MYKWKDSLNMVVFCSLWWLKRKAWRTQTFVSYKILLKIRWKVQWRLHKQTSKTFQMHREKGKSKALAYTNWHIDSLRIYFAYHECPKLFTYLETKSVGKTGKKSVMDTRFWISQCAQKSSAFGRKIGSSRKNRQKNPLSKINKNEKSEFLIQGKCMEKASLQLKTHFGCLCNLFISQKVITMPSLHSPWRI